MKGKPIYDFSKDEKGNPHSPEKIEAVMELLEEGFTWDASRKGFDWWDRVFRELDNLADAKRPPETSDA